MSTCAEFFSLSPGDRWNKMEKGRICYSCMAPKDICVNRRCSFEAKIPESLKCQGCAAILLLHYLYSSVEKTTKEFTTSKDFWKFYNKFVIKTKKSKDAQIISNIIDPISKSPVSEPAEVANAFNEFFTNINGDSNLTLDASKDFINEKFRAYKQNDLLNTSSFSFEKFTEEKVIEAIKSLDSSSSCGITEVPVSVIKNSAEVLAPFLTSIFNECITSGKIPKDLKCAIAFPLFKKGDSSLCDNYRGISVLSPFAKVLERLLSHQITNFFNSQKILKKLKEKN